MLRFSEKSLRGALSSMELYNSTVIKQKRHVIIYPMEFKIQYYTNLHLMKLQTTLGIKLKSGIIAMEKMHDMSIVLITPSFKCCRYHILVPK